MGTTPRVGVVATIEQLGKLPGGEPAAVLRATGRARVGSGVTGPGSALWVEAEMLDDIVEGEALSELAREYKNVVVSILQQRGAWQVIDSVQRISEPGELSDLAGYAPYLTNDQKLWLLETVDVEQRLAKLIEWGARAPRRARRGRAHPQRRARGHGEEPARVPAAPAARRHP